MTFDRTLLHSLRDAEQDTRRRFFLMGGTVRDADVLRRARDLWLESRAAITDYHQAALRPVVG